jgi:large subunit ribosomal protein L13Ae
LQFCTLKRVAAEVGWGYKDVVDRLEEKRKVKGKAYFERKVGTSALRGRDKADV